MKQQSIQSLRAIGFALIFLCHAEIGAPRRFGSIGVMIFFVLSGYLLRMKHKNDVFEFSIIVNIKNAIQRIKRIYPLHIITLILALPLVIGRIWVTHSGTVRSLGFLVLRICSSILLVDQWIIGVQPINPVSWYISCAFFTYIAFPYLNKITKNNSRPLMLLVTVIVFRLFYNFIFNSKNNDSVIIEYFSYYFPLLRCMDVLIGMLCFDIVSIVKYKARKKDVLRIKCIQIANLCIIVFGCWIIYLWFAGDIKCSGFLGIFFIIVELLIEIIVVMSFSGGLLVLPLFNNTVLSKIGDISAYAFLIHYVLFMWMDAIQIMFNYDFGIILRVIIAIGIFFITLIFGIGYQKWVFRFNKK